MLLVDLFAYNQLCGVSRDRSADGRFDSLIVTRRCGYERSAFAQVWQGTRTAVSISTLRTTHRPCRGASFCHPPLLDVVLTLLFIW